MHDRPNSFTVSYDIITIKLTFYMSSKLFCLRGVDLDYFYYFTIDMK